jgi:hypothetical protein
MKNKFLLLHLFLFILSVLTIACSANPEITQEPVPSDQTTTAVTTATPSLEPAVDYSTLSEEELASLITGTASQVTTTASQIKTAVTTPTLTNEEIIDNLTTLQADIYLIDALIDVYTEMYTEIAGETITGLLVIDDNLNKTAVYSNEVLAILQQDQDASSETTGQLAEAIAALETQAAETQTQAAKWFSDVQTQIEAREKRYANTPPQLGKVAYNRIDAFTQAHDFMDAFTEALEDGKFSPAELAEISELAATAESSLYNTGDPQLINHARQIDDLASHAYRGEWTQASDGLFELRISLPGRPKS